MMTGTVHAQHADSLFTVSDSIESDSARVDWLVSEAFKLRGQAPYESLKMVDSCIVLAGDLDAPLLLGLCYNRKGVLHKSVGEYDQALEVYSKAMRIFQDHGDEQAISSVLSNLGVVYEEQENFTQALDYYRQALAIDRKLGHDPQASIKLYNMGAVFFMQEQSDSAQKYFEESLTIEKEIENPEGIYFALTGLAGVHTKRNEYDTALVILKEAKAIAYQLEVSSWIGDLHHEIGQVYLQKGDTVKGIAEFQIALEKAKEVEYRNLMLQLFTELANVYDSTGNYAASIDMMRKQMALKDSIRSGDLADAMAEFATKFESEKKDLQIAKMNEEKAFNRLVLYGMIGVAFLLLILAFVIFRGYRNKQKANETLQAQAAQIQTQKENLEVVNAKIAAANLRITDSIEYAKRIQDAILPSAATLANHLQTHFIYYQPKDIVSGDFYWSRQVEGKTVFGVVDCTGHGVPGAFMTILGHGLLEKAMKDLKTSNPSALLHHLNREVYAMLRSGRDYEVTDGMDLGLVAIDYDQRKVVFCGAHHSLYVVKSQPTFTYGSKELQPAATSSSEKHPRFLYEIKGDKLFIGLEEETPQSNFTRHELPLSDGDVIYLTTDGFPDQKGGAKKKKFYYPPFRQLLVDLDAMPFDERAAFLKKTFDDWRGSIPQVDDVLIFGAKL